MSGKANPLPTGRQVEMVRVIAALAKELKRPPTQQEIGDRMGISRQGVRKTLDTVIAKGGVSADEIVIRGLYRVTDEGRKWLRQ